MNDTFFKFPSTPHLAVLGTFDIRDDKVLPECERIEFLRHELVLEEKVDGANLGISFDSSGNLQARNRGSFLEFPATGQWKKLDAWLLPKAEVLFDNLTDRLILFGEWCYARHSIFYDRLPDWFLGFDIYDRNEDRFYSCALRNRIFQAMNLAPVPYLDRGVFSLPELETLLSGSRSRFGNHPVEGFYLRLDKGGWLERRAKLVRPTFLQQIEGHWSRSGIQANRLKL